MTSKRFAVVVATLTIGGATVTGLAQATVAAADDYVQPAVSELPAGVEANVATNPAADVARSTGGLAVTGGDILELGAIGIGAVGLGTVLARRRRRVDEA